MIEELYGRFGAQNQERGKWGINMTRREMAICQVYTGICFLTGDDLKYAYDYASELMGRPVLTHEFAVYAEQLSKLAEPDFIKLCQRPDPDIPTEKGNVQKQ